MTFTLPEKLGVVDFPEDHEYHGFEATVRLGPIPLATLLDLSRRGDDLTWEDDEARSAFLDDFARTALVSWNLREPATSAGLFMQPIGFTQVLFVTWREAVKGVPLPLGLRSRDGGRSPEPSTPRQEGSSGSRRKSRKRS